MQSLGRNMYNLAKKIFPYCRSITGDGVRSTLYDLRQYISQDSGPELKIFDVPTGESAFDWTVPKEWRIRDAYIVNHRGEKIIDFQKNNLYVMGYSTPVNKYVQLEELKKYVHTLPDQPDWIPYVTSYYKERYGFCMTEKQKQSLEPGI